MKHLFKRVTACLLCVAMLVIPMQLSPVTASAETEKPVLAYVPLDDRPVVVDRVVYGANASKVAYIISDHQEAITAELLKLERGVTLMEGKGGYSGQSKQVILCAFPRIHFVPIKRVVREIDPDAFIIICDAHEILGEGFLSNTSGNL